MNMGTMYKRNELDVQSDDSSPLGSDSDEDEDITSNIIGRIEALQCSDEDEEDDEDDEDEGDDDIIQTGKYNNAYITKLINNYRSHPNILMVKYRFLHHFMCIDI